MTRTRLLWLIFVCVLLLSACAPVAAQQPASTCTMQGAWVGNFAGGPWDTPLIMLNTLTPLDPAGKKMAYVMHWVNADPTLRNPDFEEADYASDLVGQAVQTAPGTYDFSLVGYGVHEQPGDRNEILYIIGINGTLTCEDDANITTDVTLSVYTADQDADQDGLPDEGEVPQCIGPNDLGSAERIPLMPPCEPPPQ